MTRLAWAKANSLTGGWPSWGYSAFEHWRMIGFGVFGYVYWLTDRHHISRSMRKSRVAR